MKIETKFDHGDVVFYMRNNKIESSHITRITIVAYKHPNENGYVEYLEHGEFTKKEHEIFNTKQELIDSL